MMRRTVAALAVLWLGIVSSSCGGGNPPTTPIVPPPVVNPPQNSAPSIDAIAVVGRRPRQPLRFADVLDTLDVTATVRDAETSIDELTYQWSATAGTFTGTGRAVTWTAPAVKAGPIDKGETVTITLKVIERYGHPGQPKNFSQEVSATQTLTLHDTSKEVGDMSVRFLTEFSKPQSNKDWRDIMRDFKASACLDPGTVDSERLDVERHYNNYFMHGYQVSAPSTSLNFGSLCGVPGRNPLGGDACSVVPITWDSTDQRNGVRAMTTGRDYVAAVFSQSDDRFWLCASEFIPNTTFGHSFYSSR